MNVGRISHLLRLRRFYQNERHLKPLCLHQRLHNAPVGGAGVCDQGVASFPWRAVILLCRCSDPRDSAALGPCPHTCPSLPGRMHSGHPRKDLSSRLPLPVFSHDVPIRDLVSPTSVLPAPMESDVRNAVASQCTEGLQRELEMRTGPKCSLQQRITGHHVGELLCSPALSKRERAPIELKGSPFPEAPLDLLSDPLINSRHPASTSQS